jgi:PPP family 3-phenylpropionic acid transporter
VVPLLRVSIAYIAYFGAVGAAWPYLPVYYRGLGLSLGTIGALAAMSAAVQLFAAPAWGALADRFSRTRLTLPAAALVGVAGAVLLANGRDLTAIAVGVVVLAAGLAGVGPVLDARAIETLGADRIRYGQVRAIGSAAFVAVAWSVGLLIDQRDVRALFVVYVPALLLTAAVSTTLVRRPTTRAVGVARGALGLIRSPGMRLFMVGTFLVWTALVAANAFYSIRVSALGGAAETVGLVWALGAAVEVPVMWYYPRIAARYGTGRPLVVGAVLFAVRAAVAAVASDPFLLVAIAPIEGAAFGLFYVGGVTFVAERAPAGLNATAQGVLTAVAGLAAIVGSAAGGAVAGALEIEGLFAASAAIGAVAAFVIALAVRGATLRAGPALGRPTIEFLPEEIHP